MIAVDSSISTVVTAAVIVSLIFGVICGAVTAFSRKMIKIREGILRSCEEQGITIVEMAERIEKEQVEIIEDVEKEETI